MKNLRNLIKKRSSVSYLRIMKIVSVFLLVFSLTAFTSVRAYAQEELITLKEKGISLEKLFKVIEKSSKYRFLYRSAGYMDLTKTVNVDVKNKKIDDILNSVLINTGIKHSTVGPNLIVIAPVTSKKFTVSGKVIDKDGMPIFGVTVGIKSSNNVTMSDDKGYYSLNISDKDNVLVFSYIGMKKQEIQINGNELINAVLEQDATQLGEVMVVSTGYQSIPKERATGAFASVGAKELIKSPTANVLQRLEGIVPGIRIDVLAGDRSFDYQNTQIAINGGTRTVGTNDYNMIIRGASTFVGERFPLVVVDGTIRDLDISTINPNDIENVTFLKDAASASIWGTRAANGVIVITSKKGQKGQAPTVSFSTNISLAEKPDLGYLKMISSAGMLDYEKELVTKGFLYDLGTPSSYYSATPVYSQGVAYAIALKKDPNNAEALAGIERLKNIDNRSQVSKYLLQPSSSQQYNLSVSGGADYSTYFYSGSYSREIPNAVGNSGERLTVTLNNSWKLFKVATLSTNVQGTFFKYKNNALGFNSLYANSSYTLLPYQLIADKDGNGISFDRYNPLWTKTLSSAYKDWTYNYINELANADNVQKDNNYVATINLRVPIIKGLSASALYNMEKSFSNSRSYYNQETYYLRNMMNYYTPLGADKNSIGITTGGVLSQTRTDVNNYSLRGQLDYSNTFKKIHQINAVVGSEIRQTQTGQGSYKLYGYDTQTGYTNSTIDFKSMTYGTIASTSLSGFYEGGYPSQADKTRRYISYFSNISYDLLNRYVISASARYDDYNNFGLDRKYRATPMWSTGFRWNLGEEPFMSKYSWISNLSLRLTYGLNGNISTTTYPFTNIGMSDSPDQVNGMTYARVNSFANPQLRWEKSAVTNFGLDYGFLNNRISGSLEVYQKNGSDLLYSYPVNPTYGSSGYVTKNAASLKGNGVDASVNGIIYNTKDWNLNARLTFSYNTNKVNCFNNFTSYSYSSPSSLTNVNGYSTDAVFVFRNAGLDANGLTQIYDEKGNIIPSTVSTISSFKTLKYAGNRSAPYFGGFSPSFRYKQFTFSALLTYQFGGIFLKSAISSYITSAYRINYDLDSRIEERWRKSGDELTTVVPAVNRNSYSLTRYNYSDINVLKSDYIRLRNISVKYELPLRLLEKLGIKGASADFSVRNLGFLWKANDEGYDPDFISSISRTYSLPSARSYNFSLNINF